MTEEPSFEGLPAFGERGLADDDIALLLAALLHAAEAQAEAAAFFRYAVTRHYKTRPSADHEEEVTERQARAAVHTLEPWLPLPLLDVLARRYREAFRETWEGLEQQERHPEPQASPAAGSRHPHLRIVPTGCPPGSGGSEE